MTDAKDAPAATCGGGTPRSRQVSWFEVYRFVERWAARHSSDQDLLDHNLVIPGTPQWCAMSDDDATKLLAVLLGGIREALDNDTEQEHRAEASRDVASSTDWTALAQRIRTGPGNSYIPRRKGAA